MLSMCGLGTATQVFSSGFGSEIVLLVIFFSVFTAWLEDIGLTNTMTQWMLDTEGFKRQALAVYFYDFLVTFICGAFVGIMQPYF